LPFGSGHIGADNFFVRAIGSDWVLSGIVTYHSGYPIAITGTGCGTSSILNQCMPSTVLGQSARINGAYGKLTGANTATTFTTQPYLNAAAFSLATKTTVGNGAALYVPGNAARVAAYNLWGPSLFNIDLGLKRSFPLYENVKLLLEVNALNALNHVVFAAPNAVVGSGSFGELTSVANTARDFQLHAGITW
jgi:hypothetical protein